MKKCLVILLALMMVLSACSKSPQTPASPETPAEPTEPAPPSYNTYDYAEGGVIIAVPLTLPETPEDLGEEGVVFSDPEGQWTVHFKPLNVQMTEVEARNAASHGESIRTYDYFKDVSVEDSTIGGYAAKVLTFSRNPDWDVVKQGDTTFYHEGHQFIVVNYGESVIGEWGGLLINVAAPEDSTVSMSDILADEEVQMLTGQLQFHESSSVRTVSLPGLSVDFPARWICGDNGTTTLWTEIRGENSGTIYFGYSNSADPEEAAGFAGANSGEIKTLTFGGTQYHAALRRSELEGAVLENIELFAPFTENHALQVKLHIRDGDAAKMWAYAESEEFKQIMLSVKLDPAAYQEPEADRKNAEGFECNNINELKAYTGTGTDLVLPSVIGSNEIIGIGYRAFAGNTTLRSVEIPEGVQYINTGAFQGCTALEKVILPDSMLLIDTRAFAGCEALKEVQFGETLMVVGEYAFEDCSSLGNVKLPGSVQGLGTGAFAGAGDGSGLFSCPADGTFYDTSALSRTHFTRVEIGPNADLSSPAILDGAILERLTVAPGCQAVGDSFLYAAQGHEDDPLTVELNGVKTIGAYAFENRRGLSAIDLTGCETLGNDCFLGSGLKAVTIPGTVKEIPEWAFSSCPYLQTIILSEGVEHIRDNAFNSAGRIYPDAWYWYFLTPEDAEKYKSDLIPNGAPEFDRALDVELPSTLADVGEGAFSGTFVEGVYMLWCTSPDSLPAFHQHAFGGSTVLQFYFTQETIEAYGDALDARSMELDDVKDVCWYDQGDRLWWSNRGDLMN